MRHPRALRPENKRCRGDDDAHVAHGDDDTGEGCESVRRELQGDDLQGADEPAGHAGPHEQPAEYHDARRVGDRKEDHPGEGRKIEGRHDLCRAETIQEEPPGDLEQGIGVEEGRRHEPQGPHVHRDVPHQVRRQDGDGGAVEHGEPEEHRHRGKKDPPAAIAKTLDLELRADSLNPTRAESLLWSAPALRARHHRTNPARPQRQFLCPAAGRPCLLIEHFPKYLLQQQGNMCIFQPQYGGEIQMVRVLPGRKERGTASCLRFKVWIIFRLMIY